MLGDYPEHCKKFGSIPGLYIASSHPHPHPSQFQQWYSKISPDIVKCPWYGEWRQTKGKHLPGKRTSNIMFVGKWMWVDFQTWHLNQLCYHGVYLIILSFYIYYIGILWKNRVHTRRLTLYLPSSQISMHMTYYYLCPTVQAWTIKKLTGWNGILLNGIYGWTSLKKFTLIFMVLILFMWIYYYNENLSISIYFLLKYANHRRKLGLNNLLFH